MKTYNNIFVKCIVVMMLFCSQISISNSLVHNTCLDEEVAIALSDKKPEKKDKKPVKAGDIIQIDEHSGIENARVAPVEGDQPAGNQVGHINAGGWLKYENVDFGKGKLKTMKAMVCSGSQGGILEIRLDSRTGPVLTSIKIPNTGGWKSWKIASAPITGKAKGVKDIYCLFKGNGKNLYNLNWLRFSSDAVRSSNKSHRLEKGVPTISSAPAVKTSQNSTGETPEQRGRRLRDLAKGKKLGLPLGHIISIKSGNGKYLSVQGKTIKATADTVGDNERFAALSAGGNLVAIKSMATNKLFSARLNQDGIPVLASHNGEPKGW